jgi:dissimilatory sulfite reductase related protein
MPQLQVGELTLEVNEEGFIQDTTRWNEVVAAALAATEGIDELNAKHWKLVRYVRAHYLEHDVPPLIRKLCKETGFKLKEIFDMFPGGPAKGVCKVAGLPSAKGCV